mgnify:CR=1 FL=1
MIIEEDTISLPEGFTIRESEEEVLTKFDDDDKKDDNNGDDIDLPKGFTLVSIDDTKEETTVEGDPPLPARSVFEVEEEVDIDIPKVEEDWR